MKYFDAELDIGIGIHHGNVIIGSMGFAGDESLAVMGKSVNIASRLQEATKVLNTNFIISEHIYSLLDTNNNHDSTKIELKGISESIKARLIGNKYR